ncbi:unnamed protein product [Strongylus vulgaris]|uniref:Uncharacterized protein n=1 Tax=Strongylus vulgaris TaxID=40348 RepID=A0A3P7JD35_STRVU|nr:unnamed protein product [Strongylus vulgaris]
MWNRSSILILVVLLANPVLPKRASVGGGGFQPRGSSGARGAIASGRINTGGSSSSRSSGRIGGISSSGKSGLYLLYGT